MMEKRSFETLLYSVTASVVQKIAEQNHWSEDVAMERFIQSKVYALLEQEQTKLWQYSAWMLAELFQDERGGCLVLPEV